MVLSVFPLALVATGEQTLCHIDHIAQRIVTTLLFLAPLPCLQALAAC